MRPNFLNLAANSLWFYRRTNLWIALGVAIGTAVLTGALIIGESVNHTLMRQGLDRVGNVSHVISAGERLFSIELADRLQESLSESDESVAPVLSLPGMVSFGEKTANKAQIIGVDQRFFSLWDHPGKQQVDASVLDQKGSVLINDHLAKRLGLVVGDEMVLRIKKPTLLPGSIALSDRDHVYFAQRVTVQNVIDDESGGRFGLNPQQVASNSVFISIQSLGEMFEQEGKANLLLVEKDEEVERLRQSLQESLTIQDFQLEIAKSNDGKILELRSERFFVDSVVSDLVRESDFEQNGILTYLVNALEANGHSTPYSFVTGMGSIATKKVTSNSIQINSWLAEDLQATVGDTLKLKYSIINEQDGLEEVSHEFTIGDILPISEISQNRGLMPEIPGLSDAGDCRDWDPGFPIDLDLIRDKDEGYWDEFGGLPKAFVSLQDAQQLWGNDYGNYTAFWFPSDVVDPDDLATFICEHVELDSIGFQVIELRSEAVQAASNALDFRQLFVALSFIVISGALILAGLMFRVGIFQRSEEIVTLKSCGYSFSRILVLLMVEYAALIVVSSLVGVVLGIAYNQLLTWSLNTVWNGVVGATKLYVVVSPQSLLMGLFVGVVLSFIVMVRGLFKIVGRKQKLATGLRGDISVWDSTRKRSLVLAFSALVVLGTCFLVFTSGSLFADLAVGAFFGIGFLLFLGLLGLWASALFERKSRAFETPPMILTFGDLVFKQLKRDPSHTLLVTALIALGVFLVVGVGANRKESGDSWKNASSGAGGYAVYAETAFPVRQDLNDPQFRYQLGLNPNEFDQVQFVQLLQQGDGDASCVNLNSIARPRLLAVNPDLFDQRGAFSFVNERAENEFSGWLALDEHLGEREIPAVIDQSVMLWGLNKKIGDTLEYTDEQGQPFQIRLVGSLSNSIFQGSLLISEANMKRLFPSELGAQVMLLDAPRSLLSDDAIQHILDSIDHALQDFGIESMTTSDRLESFMLIENTYLSIFLILGGLGMVLGIVGFGLVIFRDIAGRRSELALLRTMGFSIRKIQRLCLKEMVLVLIIGLTIGLLAALVAVWPNIESSSNTIPWTVLLIVMVAIFATGIVSILTSVKIALRGVLIQALRKE